MPRERLRETKKTERGCEGEEGEEGEEGGEGGEEREGGNVCWRALASSFPGPVVDHLPQRSTPWKQWTQPSGQLLPTLRRDEYLALIQIPRVVVQPRVHLRVRS